MDPLLTQMQMVVLIVLWVLIQLEVLRVVYVPMVHSILLLVHLLVLLAHVVLNPMELTVFLVELEPSLLRDHPVNPVNQVTTLMIKLAHVLHVEQANNLSIAKLTAVLALLVHFLHEAFVLPALMEL